MYRPADPAQSLPVTGRRMKPHDSRHGIKVGRWFEESPALLHQMTPPHEYDRTRGAAPGDIGAIQSAFTESAAV